MYYYQLRILWRYTKPSSDERDIQMYVVKAWALGNRSKVIFVIFSSRDDIRLWALRINKILDQDVPWIFDKAITFEQIFVNYM